jgi:HSP20 family molecular chaperone IbpA
MSFVKHGPLQDDSLNSPSWTQRVDFLGQSHLVRENASTVQIAIDVPHLTAQELSVAVKGNTVVVSGNHEDYGHSEKFERHFDLDNACLTNANLHKAKLVLTISKETDQPCETESITIIEDVPPHLPEE